MINRYLALACLLVSTASLATEPQRLTHSTERQGDRVTQAVKSSLPQSSVESPLSTAADWDRKSSSLQAQAARQTERTPAIEEVNQAFWIYDAWISLYGDTDLDGYYHHLDLEFDADTQFAHADVYARLYLGIDGIFEEYHTTSVFHIDGDSSLDSLVVESEFISGFEPAEYEILIELYDAHNDVLVAVTDGIADPDLMYVPIESEDFERVAGQPTVVIVEEQGGSSSIVSLLTLMMLGLLRARYKLKNN